MRKALGKDGHQVAPATTPPPFSTRWDSASRKRGLSRKFTDTRKCRVSTSPPSVKREARRSGGFGIHTDDADLVTHLHRADDRCRSAERTQGKLLCLRSFKQRVVLRARNAKLDHVPPRMATTRTARLAPGLVSGHTDSLKPAPRVGSAMQCEVAPVFPLAWVPSSPWARRGIEGRGPIIEAPSRHRGEGSNLPTDGASPLDANEPTASVGRKQTAVLGPLRWRLSSCRDGVWRVGLCPLQTDALKTVCQLHLFRQTSVSAPHSLMSVCGISRRRGRPVLIIDRRGGSDVPLDP